MTTSRDTPADPSAPAVFLVTSGGGGGLTRDEVRGRRFRSPSRGVRLLAEESDPVAALTAAAVITAPQTSVLCDVSAARHWELPLPPWIGLEAQTLPVGVAVLRGTSRQRRRGVRGRRLELPDEHLTSDGGFTVTSPARTWVDCAELVPLEYLVAMGDVVLRHDLAQVRELQAIVHWAYRRRGVRRARAALPLLDPGAESPGESLARCALVQRGVRQPECNVDIVERGQWLARADMAWRRERVIVEYDGIVHLPEMQRRSDARRRNRLQDAGWLVIVFTADDLTRPDAMAALVRSALRR